MRLFYLQLRSFYLRFVFFTCRGEPVSRKDQTQFADGGTEAEQTKPTFQTGETVFHREQKDQTEFRPEVEKTKPIYRK